MLTPCVLVIEYNPLHYKTKNIILQGAPRKMLRILPRRAGAGRSVHNLQFFFSLFSKKLFSNGKKYVTI